MTVTGTVNAVAYRTRGLARDFGRERDLEFIVAGRIGGECRRLELHRIARKDVQMKFAADFTIPDHFPVPPPFPPQTDHTALIR